MVVSVKNGHVVLYFEIKLNPYALSECEFTTLKAWNLRVISWSMINGQRIQKS